MSTTSTIAMKNEDGTYISIYCHLDGCPSHHLPILEKNYSEPKDVERLLSYGDMSVLAERCEGSPNNSFDNSDGNTCIYYGRDRGEEDTDPKIYHNYNDLKFNSQSYLYVYDPETKTWEVEE